MILLRLDITFLSVWNIFSASMEIIRLFSLFIPRQGQLYIAFPNSRLSLHSWNQSQLVMETQGLNPGLLLGRRIFLPLCCNVLKNSWVNKNMLSAHLNAEFQRKARRDKKTFLSDQCKEIEEHNRMGKSRVLFKKIKDTKGHFMQR